MINEMERVLGNLLKEKQPQDYIRIIEEENDKLYEQIDQLTNNWNELEEYLQKGINNAEKTGFITTSTTLKIILDKMKELKEGNNENN